MKRWPAILPHGEYVIITHFTSNSTGKTELIADLKMYADVKTIR